MLSGIAACLHCTIILIAELYEVLTLHSVIRLHCVLKGQWCMSFDQTLALLIFEVSCFTGVDVVRTAVSFFAWSSVNVRMMKKVKPPESVQLRTQY